MFAKYAWPSRARWTIASCAALVLLCSVSPALGDQPEAAVSGIELWHGAKKVGVLTVRTELVTPRPEPQAPAIVAPKLLPTLDAAPNIVANAPATTPLESKPEPISMPKVQAKILPKVGKPRAEEVPTPDSDSLPEFEVNEPAVEKPEVASVSPSMPAIPPQVLRIGAIGLSCVVVIAFGLLMLSRRKKSAHTVTIGAE
jgi:hypothetical protein